MHLLRQPIDFPASVAEDDGLGDGNSLVQIAKSVELPLLLLYRDVELLDTLEGQLVTLDKDANGVTHELLGDLEHVRRHGSGEQDDLGVLGEKLEDFVDLVLETTGQHLIGLVETEQLDRVRTKSPTVDHVEDTTRRADDDVDTLLELGHVLTDVGTTDTCVAFDVHVVTEGDDDLLDLLRELTSGSKNQSLGPPDSGVNLLEDGDGEGSGLASARLGLSDNIVTLDDRDDGPLLNSRWTLETTNVCVSQRPRKQHSLLTRRRRCPEAARASGPCYRS